MVGKHTIFFISCTFQRPNQMLSLTARHRITSSAGEIGKWRGCSICKLINGFVFVYFLAEEPIITCCMSLRYKPLQYTQRKKLLSFKRYARYQLSHFDSDVSIVIYPMFVLAHAKESCIMIIAYHGFDCKRFLFKLFYSKLCCCTMLLLLERFRMTFTPNGKR